MRSPWANAGFHEFSRLCLRLRHGRILLRRDAGRKRASWVEIQKPNAKGKGCEDESGTC